MGSLADRIKKRAMERSNNEGGSTTIRIRAKGNVSQEVLISSLLTASVHKAPEDQKLLRAWVPKRRLAWWPGDHRIAEGRRG